MLLNALDPPAQAIDANWTCSACHRNPWGNLIDLRNRESRVNALARGKVLPTLNLGHSRPESSDIKAGLRFRRRMAEYGMITLEHMLNYT